MPAEQGGVRRRRGCTEPGQAERAPFPKDVPAASWSDSTIGDPARTLEGTVGRRSGGEGVHPPVSRPLLVARPRRARPPPDPPRRPVLSVPGPPLLGVTRLRALPRGM